MTQHYDVIIVGGGVVGLSLAVCFGLARMRVAVVDPKLSAEPNLVDELMVSAVNYGSLGFLRQYGVWSHIDQSEHSPFTNIKVWDGRSAAKIDFDCRYLGKSELGHIIKNNSLRTALLARLHELTTVDLLCASGEQITYLSDMVRLQLGQGPLTARLLVGADGTNSWVRQQIGIECVLQDYGQHALVTTVTTELSHQQTAMQRFVCPGILAFLPLPAPQQAAIVYSHSVAEVAALKAMGRDEFHRRLAQAFDFKLGRITDSMQRLSFPLRMSHARHYVAPRVAIVGDAAHTLHPLAGQGLNLGIQDVKSLAKAVLAAYSSQRDWGAYDTLRSFEREQKGHNQLMLQLMDGFNTLFGSSLAAVHSVRGWGLQWLQQQLWLKRKIMRFAMGIS